MKLFISYSHDSEEHRQRVQELAARLRQDGVDACVDFYVTAPAEGWPRWTQRRLEEADRVIVVCTDTYRRRFDGREQRGTGQGATLEGLLITQLILNADTETDKFIPVVPDGEDEPSVVPLMLQPFQRYRYPSQYPDLYRRINGRPAVIPPPIGPGRGAGEFSEPLAPLKPVSRGATPKDPVPLRALVLEDDPEWQATLKEVLEEVAHGAVVDVAASLPPARQLVRSQRYDLAVIDRSLSGHSDDIGLDLLSEMGPGSLNRSCAVIVLTVNAKGEDLFKVTFEQHGQQVRILRDKGSFDDDRFIATARAALLAARLRTALPAFLDQRRCFTVSFDQERLLGGRLTGPTGNVYRTDRPFDGSPFAELLDAAVEEPPAAGRESIGRSLYESVVASDERLFETLAADEILSRPTEDTVLKWSGPVPGLGVPFELLTEGDGREPWCLRHAVTRHLDLADHAFGKTVTFAQLIERLQKEKESLRILLVAGGGERAEVFDREIAELAATIAKELEELGLPCVPPVLCSSATLPILRRVIREGRPHILHYAGTGRRGDALPAGVALRQDFLTAEALARLVENSDLYLAVFNGCPGLHGTGRFGGLFEALVRADVPAVLGHRWPVSDETSLLLATVFYRELWRTFSPGDALLAARRACAAAGGDDEAWGSPVLVLQNA